MNDEFCVRCRGEGWIDQKAAPCPSCRATSADLFNLITDDRIDPNEMLVVGDHGGILFEVIEIGSVNVLHRWKEPAWKLSDYLKFKKLRVTYEDLEDEQKQRRIRQRYEGIFGLSTDNSDYPPTAD